MAMQLTTKPVVNTRKLKVYPQKGYPIALPEDLGVSEIIKLCIEEFNEALTPFVGDVQNFEGKIESFMSLWNTEKKANIADQKAIYKKMQVDKDSIQGSISNQGIVFNSYIADVKNTIASFNALLSTFDWKASNNEIKIENFYKKITEFSVGFNKALNFFKDNFTDEFAASEVRLNELAGKLEWLAEDYVKRFYKMPFRVDLIFRFEDCDLEDRDEYAKHNAICVVNTNPDESIIINEIEDHPIPPWTGHIFLFASEGKVYPICCGGGGSGCASVQTYVQNIITGIVSQINANYSASTSNPITLPNFNTLCPPDSNCYAWYDNNLEATEFYISNYCQLCYFRDLVNAGDDSFENKTVYLSSDITANVSDSWNTWTSSTADLNEWEPISSNFRGTFDGQGYSIWGLFINTPSASGATGFFAAISGKYGSNQIRNFNINNSFINGNNNVAAVIGNIYPNMGGIVSVFNINVNNAVIQGNSNIGGIAGNLTGNPNNPSDKTTYGIYDCNVSGISINPMSSYTNNIGGICGLGSVSDCTAQINIVSANSLTNVGGIIGSGFYIYNSQAEINFNYENGNVSGGIAGNISYSSWLPCDIITADNIFNCSSSGSINCAYANDVGGILGAISIGILSSSYSSVDLIGGNNVGGAVGRISEAVVSSCYATGNATANYNNAGGFCGNEQNNSIISNCYSTGIPIANSSPTAGGLVGNASNYTSYVLNSFYDQDASGMSDTGKGEPLPTSTMQTAYFANDILNIAEYHYDLNSVLYSGADGSYPTLSNTLQTADIGATFFAGGDGLSSATAWMITTYEQLLNFSRLVSCGKSFDGEFIQLGATIDCSSLGTQYFEIIGKNNRNFHGTFDGNNFSISNVNIDFNTSNIQENAGIFEALCAATVSNLNIVDIAISGTNSKLAGSLTADSLTSNITGVNVYSSSGQLNITYASGLIGKQNMGQVDSCTVNNADITIPAISNIDVGGVIGLAQDTSIVACSSSGCNISAAPTDNVGGLIGRAFGPVDIESCSAINGSVSGKNRVGGLVGEARNTGINFTWIKTCFTNNIAITGNNSIGGIAGEMQNFYAEYSAAKGSQTITGNQQVGGFVGNYICGSYAVNNVGQLNECYAEVNVASAGASNALAFGGFIGALSESIPGTNTTVFPFENCYSRGSVCAGDSVPSRIGGFVGSISSPSTPTNRMFCEYSISSAPSIGNGSNTNIGGFVGYVYNSAGSLSFSGLIYDTQVLGGSYLGPFTSADDVWGGATSLLQGDGSIDGSWLELRGIYMSGSVVKPDAPWLWNPGGYYPTLPNAVA